jgi:hypothetical protein
MPSLIIKLADLFLHENLVSASPERDASHVLGEANLPYSLFIIEVLVGPLLNLFLWLAKMGGGNPELVVAVYLGEKWWGTLPL